MDWKKYWWLFALVLHFGGGVAGGVPFKWLEYTYNPPWGCMEGPCGEWTWKVDPSLFTLNLLFWLGAMFVVRRLARGRLVS